MNGELRRDINVKHMLKRKLSRCNSSVNWENYRKQRKIVTQLRRKSMQMYMQNKYRNAKNNGEFWKAVEPLISNKVINKDDNMFINIDGNVVNDPSDLCRVFKTYFTNIAYSIGPNDTIYGSDSSESCIRDYAAHRSVNQITNLMNTAHTRRAEFNFEMVGVSTVRTHLTRLDIKKATGHDMIPPKVLNMGSDILCYPLCYLLNTCFSSCSYSGSLKQAGLCPIFKKGDTMDVVNYRPVSILPSASKVFEKEMVYQMSKYFEDLFNSEKNKAVKRY